MTKKNNIVEFIVGIAVIVIVILTGSIFLGDKSLVFRMFVGLSLGYTLMRSAFGFAGSVNRAYNTGSTRLMKTLMYMFLASSIMTAAILYASGDASQYGLWVNQINLGLLLGGIIFGFGMSFSMCCASGVLTDMVDGTTRALITILFFGIGVFIGFPLQKTQSWISDTWFHTETFKKGVFFPDLFKWDGMDGYLGSIILTAILCGIVIYLSRLYENKRRQNNTYTGVISEKLQDEAKKEEILVNEGKSEDKGIFYRLFVKPWSLAFGATVITGIFTTLMIVTKSGWGASTPYGYWFGRLLRLFGVSAESLAAFTHQATGPFTMPFFKNGMNVQNISIIIGAAIALLLAGNFAKSMKAGFKVSGKEVLIYAVGGLLMGFGTRLGNGCNVGALYTPIANFSLSGWIYLVVLVTGGVLGNMVKKRIIK